MHTRLNPAILTHNDPGIFDLLPMLRSSGCIRTGIVLDDYSEHCYVSDLKRECKLQGFEFRQRKLRFNFGRQRNVAMGWLPENEWVLTIDPDERPSHGLLASISAAIEMHPEFNSVCLWRKNITHYSEGEPRIAFEETIRVFVNNGSIRYSGRIHECLANCNPFHMPNEEYILHEKLQSVCQARHNWYDEHFYKKGIGI